MDVEKKNRNVIEIEGWKLMFWLGGPFLLPPERGVGVSVGMEWQLNVLLHERYCPSDLKINECEKHSAPAFLRKLVNVVLEESLKEMFDNLSLSSILMKGPDSAIEKFHSLSLSRILEKNFKVELVDLDED